MKESRCNMLKRKIKVVKSHRELSGEQKGLDVINKSNNEYNTWSNGPNCGKFSGRSIKISNN